MDRTPGQGGVPLELRYLIRDRDCDYGAATRRLRAMGIRDKPIALGSLWQNGFAERLIGLIRRECIGHVIVWAKRTYAGF
jgi:transposase InsO family protein